VNVPLSAGADDSVYLTAFERIVLPIREQFNAELVLVSAGYDAHAKDPLANMAVTEAGYEQMAASLSRGAEGRFGLLLEGGYDLGALGASVARTVSALDDSLPHVPAPKGDISARHEADLARVVSAQSEHWKL
jgi:acetoin utilization deacetylase AcuC-like enzyme